MILREKIIAEIQLWFGPLAKVEDCADRILAIPEIREALAEIQRRGG